MRDGCRRCRTGRRYAVGRLLDHRITGASASRDRGVIATGPENEDDEEN